jgi:hypothetical protein
MQIDEIISLVASEPTRVILRNVRVLASDTMAKASMPGGMRMTDFLSAPARTERREFRYGHIMGAPASRETIEEWKRKWSVAHLPSDLEEFVCRINGVHLWANIETGRSYIGLAPVEEWETARVKMYGATADPSLLDDRLIALSYHQDGESFVVLDLASGRYYLIDSAGPDETSPVGENIGDLLDWFWNSRIAPKE